MEAIYSFVAADDARTRAKLASAKRRAQARIVRQMRCMQEFINVNGRLHRYGFVSADEERTRVMAQQLSGGDLRLFHSILHLPPSTFATWEAVDPAALQLARTTTAPPPPVAPPGLDRDTREWLQCSALRRVTDTAMVRQSRRDQLDMADVLAKMEGVVGGTADTYDWPAVQALASAAAATHHDHGPAELTFAALAALSTTRTHTSVYAQMLKYIATTAHNNTFAPLPPGGGDRTPPDVLRAFLHKHDPDFALPLAATTLPTLDAFKQLCVALAAPRM